MVNSLREKLWTYKTNFRMKEVYHSWQDELNELFCPTPETRRESTETQKINYETHPLL